MSLELAELWFCHGTVEVLGYNPECREFGILTFQNEYQTIQEHKLRKFESPLEPWAIQHNERYKDFIEYQKTNRLNKRETFKALEQMIDSGEV